MSAAPKDQEPVVAPKAELEVGQSDTELTAPTTEPLTSKVQDIPASSIVPPAEAQSTIEPILENSPTTTTTAVQSTESQSPLTPNSPPPAQPAQNLYNADPTLFTSVTQEATSTIVADQPTATPSLDDDGYASDGAVSGASASATSSIRDYGFEHGRRYHKFREGSYQFPNDEKEQDREDMKHAMCVNLCGGKLHFAPIDSTKSLNIIDVGTGTGIWAIDMGDEYPSANILGIDLSPIQPSFVPPNVRFMVDDAESTWLHGPEVFDYVHFRHMSPALKNPDKTLEQAYASMKPGGWVELQDLTPEVFCDDDTMPDNYLVGEWLMLFADGLSRLGPDVLAPKSNIARLTRVGFTNIQQVVYKCPIGPWARNPVLRMVGLYERSALYDGLEAMSLGGLVRGLGWTVTEMQVYLVGVRRSLLDGGVHGYVYYYNTWGQKPEV